jgi:hypothetical protein
MFQIFFKMIQYFDQNFTQNIIIDSISLKIAHYSEIFKNNIIYLFLMKRIFYNFLILLLLIFLVQSI